MSNGNRLPRRRLLQVLGGALALAGLPLRLLRAAPCEVSLAAVRACVDDVPHAAAVGRAWLAAQPAAAADGAALLAAIGAAVARDGAVACDAGAIHAAILRDYREGVAEWAGDWWLSRTEARVYAVLALEGDDGRSGR